MKKLLYPICTCILLLSACAKKSTPDRMMCDCFDRETSAYITAHPSLTEDGLAAAKEAIATPCLAEFQKAYPESEQKELDKQYTKAEQKAMESALEICSTNVSVSLKKAADKNTSSVASTGFSEDKDSTNSMADNATDRAEDSADNCEDFLDKYEEYADSYATVAAKYARNPSDMSTVSEYTDMATKAQEMEQTKPDACQTDAAFMKRYTRITAKVTKAAAAQMQGSAKMLEQMSK